MKDKDKMENVDELNDDELYDDEFDENWYERLPENPKNLIELAAEYPEKKGLQQLAKAYEDGVFFIFGPEIH